MAVEAKPPTLDTRGYALGIWADPEKGVDEKRLPGTQRRQVGTMLAAGWLDRVEGLLFLNETGHRAVADLRPARMPKLTEAQEDLLRDLIERRASGADLSYQPALKLIAYGAVDVHAQRFGGLRLAPTARALAWHGSGPPENEASPEAGQDSAQTGPHR